MSNPSKAKGYRFEVECCDLAESLGFTHKRAWGSNGAAIGEHHEVDILIGGEKYQCKRRAKIAQDLFPGEHVEGQIIRADRQKCAYIVLPLPTFLNKYKKAHDELKRVKEGASDRPAEIRGEDTGATVRRADEADGR